MTVNDEALLTQIARRNWIVLGLLTLLSLAAWTPLFTLGVLSGGLLSILGYRWLNRSLVKVFKNPDPGAARKFQFNYFIRLGTLACMIYLLLAQAKVHPIGLIIGLSVVVINIFWTTLRRVI